MTYTAEPLDPLSLPLQGERLIEASAGTGKTYTITPSMRACWTRLRISNRLRNGCCWPNGKWMKRPSSPFTVFVSAC